MRSTCLRFLLDQFTSSWLLIGIIVLEWGRPARCMSGAQIATLRQDARDIFYHGLTNYRKHAYPEDELRPLSCAPLTRDRSNPSAIEVNDVLGNYSLTLIDGLSTLAILASRPTSQHDNYDALHDFQQSIAMLVDEYGDGSEGQLGQGRRARGFDLDSKVQLFETTIRGVGGLLSAHLFAIGELPIRGYKPDSRKQASGEEGIMWNADSGRGDQFVYNGQLLRLAYDMGKRLLPAFHTPTGIPYPRVNLRHGVPFYENSPLNNDAGHGKCDATETPKSEREITETCSAGAGSLVLEFTVLSRLTGDVRFEKLAKKAFWAVWERRTNAGLVGAGIDAETGQWIGPYTGIGAGIDSFFEYALKSHILLSGAGTIDPAIDEPNSSAFLDVWDEAHTAIKRHIYRASNSRHPHYAQNDMYSGGPRLAWVDSLSAYYPGLLVLGGEVEEATSTHLFYTALWNRYGALPERWNTFTGQIDSGLRWWGGRPEFIESAWYLYRATNDPWYLHVGDMAMQDIWRRCWTRCGWAGLQDVRTGEQSDRMESFFLGETAKYLYLLFDEEHPLNHLDAAFVFTTEGHPLVIPRRYRRTEPDVGADPINPGDKCPAPPVFNLWTGSAVTSRKDVFHAAYLARLHESTSEQRSPDPDTISDTDFQAALLHQSPTERIFYPWTLPRNMVPDDGICSRLPGGQTFDLSFPVLPNVPSDISALQRIDSGILIKSISGLRLSLVLEDDETHAEQPKYRVYALSSLTMGRDESIWMGADVMSHLSPADPYLSRNKDVEVADLLIDVPTLQPPESPGESATMAVKAAVDMFNHRVLDYFASSGELMGAMAEQSPGELLMRTLPEGLLTDPPKLADHFDLLADRSDAKFDLPRALRDAAAGLRSSLGSKIAEPTSHAQTSSVSLPEPTMRLQRHSMPVMLPSGPGAAPLPANTEMNPDPSQLLPGKLTFRRILLLESDLCAHVLPADIARDYNVIIIRRGGCSFNEKLRAIPSYPPSERSLKLVVAVSFPEHETEKETSAPGGAKRRAPRSGERQHISARDFFIRPFLHEEQSTPVGSERRNPVPLVMVGGGEHTWEMLRNAAGVVGHIKGGHVLLHKRGPDGEWRGDMPLENGQGDGPVNEDWDGDGGGLSIKRRYWFASNGIRISNLHVAV